MLFHPLATLACFRAKYTLLFNVKSVVGPKRLIEDLTDNEVNIIIIRVNHINGVSIF